VVGYLWKSPDLSKGFTFSWTPLLDCIPTHLNLAKMGVVEVETSRNLNFCSNVEESTIYLFLHFEMVSKVWLKVFNLLQLNLTMPPNLFVHLDCWTQEAGSKDMRKGF